MLGDVLADGGTDVSGFADLEHSAVNVLHTGRTLLEKLYAIHDEVIRFASDVAVTATARVARHFHDVSQLLAAEEVVTFLADDATVQTVLERIEHVSREHFTRGVPGELRREGGFRLSPAFDVTSDAADRLRMAHESDMEDLHSGTSPTPTWEEICQQVASDSV